MILFTSFSEFGDNPLWCDCDLDWMRAKQWLGIDLAKSGTDINFITFASGVHDKQTQKCAGPGIFTGKFPWDFDTLCGELFVALSFHSFHICLLTFMFNFFVHFVGLNRRK